MDEVFTLGKTESLLKRFDLALTRILLDKPRLTHVDKDLRDFLEAGDYSRDSSIQIMGSLLSHNGVKTLMCGGGSSVYNRRLFEELHSHYYYLLSEDELSSIEKGLTERLGVDSNDLLQGMFSEFDPDPRVGVKEDLFGILSVGVGPIESHVGIVNKLLSEGNVESFNKMKEGEDLLKAELSLFMDPAELLEMSFGDRLSKDLEEWESDFDRLNAD